jgi:DeoR/GlpR family transcriptional regulator of sugar metabolism
MAALAESRRQSILARLNSLGQILVSDLAKRLGVSEMTIRRDLGLLEDMGLAVRVHGGALAGAEARFDSRLAANSRAKARAVAKLAPHLPESGCVYFDGSTTVLNLIRHLRGRNRLQVATNNVATFSRLAAVRGPSPLLLGGSLDFRTDNLIGPLAIRSLESLAFEKAFFSARGLHPDAGLNEVTVDDAEVKAKVAVRTRAVYVAVDHSKLGVTSAGSWSAAGKKPLLATDLPPGDSRLDPYRKSFAAIL